MQRVHFRVVQRCVGFVGGDVLRKLLHVGHTRQRHRDLRDGLQKAERPAGDSLVWAQRVQALGILRRERSELAAAQRLHDPDGDVILLQQLDLRFRVLERPVEVVDLKLAELHILAVGFEEALKHIVMPVAGEAEVADAPIALLLDEVVVNAVLRVEILLDVHLAHVVEQIKIKILHAALCELLLKNFADLGHIAEIVAGELGGEVVDRARIGGQCLADDSLGVPVVIAPSGVKIIHPVLQRVGDHFGDLRGVDILKILAGSRQAHTAQPQRGQLFALKILVDHNTLPCCSSHHFSYSSV